MEKKKVYTFKITSDCNCELTTDFSREKGSLEKRLEEFEDKMKKEGLNAGRDCWKLLSWKLPKKLDKSDVTRDDELIFDVDFTVETTLKAIEIEKNESRERLWTINSAEDLWENWHNNQRLFSDYYLLTNYILPEIEEGKAEKAAKLFGTKTEDIDAEILAEILAAVGDSIGIEIGNGEREIDTGAVAVNGCKAELVEVKEYDKI